MTFALLTGATRGIGRAAAIEIAREGIEVALVGREAERVKAVAQEAKAAGGGAPVHEYVADLTLMAEVRALADDVRGRYEHIDVLANNAGALFASRMETSEGFEQTFALNHLARFLLTNLPRDHLDGGRVVTTASDAHKSGRLDLEDLQSERSYSAMRVYGTSKLCNILFTRELAKRAGGPHADPRAPPPRPGHARLHRPLQQRASPPGTRPMPPVGHPSAAPAPTANTPVLRRDRLGGLLHEYYKAAA